MGLKFFRRRQDTEGPVPTEMSGAKERYNAYFPRLFAYVRSCVGGDMPAQEIMVQAFYQALLARGKKPMQAIVAVMRKLLHAIHGMFSNNEGFIGERFYQSNT